MAFELEALVGHLYVVGGRAINMMPPGALVEVAPRKAARGRETDTLFVLVLPGGDETAPAAFYEQMATLAAERYFNSTGSVTAALRHVFHILNENLYEHNQNEKRRFEASLVCAVLRSADLYLARAGAGVAVLYQNGAVHEFPDAFEHDEALFGLPLGVQPAPVVKMSNYRVGEGTRLLLSDAALADIERPTISGALAAASLPDLLGAVKSAVPIQISLAAVEFVRADAEVAVPVRPTESSRAQVSAPPPAPAAPSAEAPSTSPPRERRRGLPLPVLAALGGAARLMGQGAETALRVLDRLLPPLGEGQTRWFATPAAAGAAVLVPVLVVMLVVIMWIGGTGASEFDLCVQRSSEAATIARGIASNDVQGTIAAWSAASEVAAECQRLRPETPDETLDAIRSQARQIIDQLMVITRRDNAVIASFPQAVLTQAILQGQDLFVLDDGNDQVYRITLTDDGMSMAPNTRQALLYMRRGVQLNEYRVGDLIDIAWAEDGTGLSQSNALVAVDREGLVIDCAPRFVDTCSGQRVQGVENWINPRAVQLWNGRLYILDPGANQLWRYDPNAGAFANAPIEYFSGEGRPDIRTAVDFSIDAEGVVYILLSDGTVLKFRGGERLDFAFAGFPQGQPITSADAFFLNTNPLQPGLYIVSRGMRSIYETLLGGTFVHNFRAQNETYYESLSAVIFSNDPKVIYALSGNSIFAFPRDV